MPFALRFRRVVVPAGVALLALVCAAGVAARAASSPAPLHYGGCWLLDADGRYFNPRGFVVLMEDSAGPLEYTAADYQRMVHYGANTQVIRVSIGMLSGLGGEDERRHYLTRVDERVRLGRDVGIHTIFKMTVYGLKDFNQRWDELYDRDGEFRPQLFAAWNVLWRRYATEPSVLGYDLVNEPFRDHTHGAPRSYDDVVQHSLVPLYTELIHALDAISPDKWAIYQPLLVDIDDRTGHPLPCYPIQMPPVSDRMILAPHGYFDKSAQHRTAVIRHQQEARAAGAALMMGEWGRQTFVAQDTDLAAQQACTRLYIETAEIFDAAGMGLIKPWFTGTRRRMGRDAKYTWAVFSDPSPTGTAERKYIMDVIARPAPLVISGARVESYGFDFVRREFTARLIPEGPARGLSEIYVPEDRHYPDGFTLRLNDEIVLVRDRSSPGGLRVNRALVSLPADAITYDEASQRVRIKQWPAGGAPLLIRVLPGVQVQ